MASSVKSLHSLAPPPRQSDGHQSLHVLYNFKECLERDCKVGSWTSWTTECRIPGPGLLQCPPRICPWYVMGLPRRDVHDGCGINTRTRKILQHPYCPRALYISGKCKVSCPQTREARSCKCPGGIISNHIFWFVSLYLSPLFSFVKTLMFKTYVGT